MAMLTTTLKHLPAPGLRLLALATILLAVITFQASGATNDKHFFWAPGQAPNPGSVSNDLIYHGGNAGPGAIGVETTPAIYLIFWGPDWANGFTTTDANGIQYTSQQLKGVWTDPAAVPSDIIALGLAENVADDPLSAEAIRASAHFGYNPQATYIILTPPTSIATGQPVYCGYHTQTSSVDGLGNPYRLQYAFIPFLNMNWPGLGTGGCGMNSVNVTSDS